MQVHALELLPVTPGCSMHTELTWQQLDLGTGRVGWATPHPSLVSRPGEPLSPSRWEGAVREPQGRGKSPRAIRP